MVHPELSVLLNDVWREDMLVVEVPPFHPMKAPADRYRAASLEVRATARMLHPSRPPAPPTALRPPRVRETAVRRPERPAKSRAVFGSLPQECGSSGTRVRSFRCG